MCAYKRVSPLPVIEGGTQNQSFVENSVICGGTTSTGALQNVPDVGNIFQVLTSVGAGSPPEWDDLANPTFFQPLSSDPVSPMVSDVWYNTTSNEFKGFLGVANAWVSKSNMSIIRRGHSGTQLGGDAFAIGGTTSNTVLTPVVSTDYYTTMSNTWGAKANLNNATEFAAAASLDSDNSLAFAGNNTYTRFTQLYNLTGNTWTSKTLMAIGQDRLGGCSLSTTTALAMGGENNLTAAQLYDLMADTWTIKNSLITGVSNTTGASINSGDGLVTNGVTQLYDTSGDSWSTGGSLNFPRVLLASAGLTSNIVISFGGLSASYYAVTELYKFTTNVWSNDAPMNTARDELGGAALSSTTALSFGGSNGSTLNTTELYEGGAGLVVVFDLTVV